MIHSSNDSWMQINLTPGKFDANRSQLLRKRVTWIHHIFSYYFSISYDRCHQIEVSICDDCFEIHRISHLCEIKTKKNNGCECNSHILYSKRQSWVQNRIWKLSESTTWKFNNFPPPQRIHEMVRFCVGFSDFKVTIRGMIGCQVIDVLEAFYMFDEDEME